MSEITIEQRRHSAAHMMARAIMNLFEDVQVDIGPATDDGFYYDFDLPHRISPEDFPKIEAEIAKDQEKADELYSQYTSKLAKETDVNKQEKLTAKYEEQITKLIVNLQEKAEKMTVKGMDKAAAAGLTVDMVYVDIKFGDRYALIDPIIVVAW